MSKFFTVRDLPVYERPRERLLKLGVEAMSTQELLAIIMGRGIKGHSVLSIVQELFNRFGNLKNMSMASIADFDAVKGIGTTKAAQIKAVFELSRRIERESDEVNVITQIIKKPVDVLKVVQPILRGKKREHFLLLSLNTRNHVIGTQTISIGSLDSSIVHPREVFQAAILDHAASVILIHNHPSGNPEPSEDDIKLTRRLIDSGQTLGIDVLDHIIVSDRIYFSMKEKNML